eukprot:7537398-Alexandrium_andersonii.AAC.1
MSLSWMLCLFAKKVRFSAMAWDIISSRSTKFMLALSDKKDESACEPASATCRQDGARVLLAFKA